MLTSQFLQGLAHKATICGFSPGATHTEQIGPSLPAAGFLPLPAPHWESVKGLLARLRSGLPGL